MTKLLKSLIITKKNECDEWTINSHYNPKGYTDIIILCSILNKKPIPTTELNTINQLYKSTQKYRLTNNKTKQRETQNKLQNHIQQNYDQLTIFLKNYEQTKLTTDDHPEAYDNFSIGVLSFEDNED